MKSLFEPSVLDDTVHRICALQPEAERMWGKMDPAQMMAHCRVTLAMAAGQLNMPRLFLGRVLGPLFKSQFVGEKAFRRDGPTASQLVVTDVRNFERERKQLIKAIRDFGAGGPGCCTRHPHPFFGNLTPGEWGRVMFKHLDHHLRQFGG